MIGAESIPATHHGGVTATNYAISGEGTASEPSLISRVLLAMLLAAGAVLIPGEATRALETPLSWSDLFQRQPRPGSKRRR